MEQLSLVEKLIDPKIWKVLQAFFDDEDKEFYLTEVSKNTKLPPASVFRILKTLVSLGAIELVMVNKFKFYKVKKSKETDALKSLVKKDKRILDLFVEKIRELPGIRQIILHGHEEKDKADVLLIGESLDAAFIKSVVFEIKDKYNYTISWLPLAVEQYEQMVSMGMYGEEKKTLFLRKTT